MSITKPPHIYISAGEASGDLLGAGLAKALLKKNSQLKLSGMGGTQMASAGVDLVFDANRLSVVGIFEILTHLPIILKIFHQIKKYLRIKKPDLIIFIDFPDTHLRISKLAKKLGIPVLYYVSPQIWAWRASRIHHIKKTVDHMAVLFGFEEKIYQQANIPVTFVGHHLKKSVKPSMDAALAYRYFNLDSKKPIVALLPGSRTGEVKKHLSTLLETAKIIRNQRPEIQFALPIANSLDATKIKAQLPNYVIPVVSHLYDLLQITDAAVAVSGTVTLEVALMQVPMCIVYRLNPLTYWLAKQLAQVSQIGLCNIVIGKTVAKELVQSDATPKKIAAEVFKLLSDTTYATQIKTDFAQLKQSLGDGQSSKKVAEIALDLLQNNK